MSESNKVFQENQKERIELELELRIKDGIRLMLQSEGFLLVTANKNDAKGWTSHAAFFSGEDWDKIKEGVSSSIQEMDSLVTEEVEKANRKDK